ncbi:MAG: PilZ domain-containing protein [Leptospiraceae bacterium]|nr:PilZ domain-containing protein [Leptospiraceae bacterium]
MEEHIEERRQYERFPVSISANINSVKCHVANISYGGMLVLTTYPAKINEIGIIDFEYDGKCFTKEAIVRDVYSSTPLGISKLGKSHFAYHLHLAFKEPIKEEELLRFKFFQ